MSTYVPETSHLDSRHPLRQVVPGTFRTCKNDSYGSHVSGLLKTSSMNCEYKESHNRYSLELPTPLQKGGFRPNEDVRLPLREFESHEENTTLDDVYVRWYYP